MDLGAWTGQAEMLTMEYTNWREREQARNLCRKHSPLLSRVTL
jgi:hypothetical protein